MKYEHLQMIIWWDGYVNYYDDLLYVAMSSLFLEPDWRFGDCVRMFACVQIYCMVQVGTKIGVTQEFFNRSCLIV